MESSSAPKSIDLASLSQGMPGLTSACGTMLAESASVCLEDRKHQAGVRLAVTGMVSTHFDLAWPVADDQRRRCYNDLQEATERGACGVAILILKELTGMVVVERSRKGPGFDYWLGNEDDDVLFEGKVRLEVSGILSGRLPSLESRVRQKKDQISPSDDLAPGIVAVVEFGKPIARVEEK